MADSRDSKGSLLPAYFVADESVSMENEIGALNEGLVALHDAVNMDGMMAAKVRLSVVGFADDVKWHLPLSDLREVRRMPELSIRGGTSYGTVFVALRKRIPRDIDDLKRRGYRVHRPVVFFLTDGQPTDLNWQAELRDLTGQDFKQRPNVITFGFGDALGQTLLEVATNERFAFIASSATDPGKAIAAFFEQLTQSLVQSAATVDGEVATLVVPKPDPDSGVVMVLDIVS